MTFALVCMNVSVNKLGSHSGGKSLAWWNAASFSVHLLFIRTRMIGNRQTKALKPVGGWNEDRDG